MNYKQLLPTIKAFVFDVDGVLARQSLFFLPQGEALRSMNIKDGYALQLAVKKGFPIAIITGGDTESLVVRFNGLGITDLYLRCRNKKEAFDDFIYKYGLNPKELIYMGDDLPDYEVMKQVGLPVCPCDACDDIKAISLYISPIQGGEGCVRDIVEQTLRAQNKWMEKDAFEW